VVCLPKQAPIMLQLDAVAGVLDGIFWTRVDSLNPTGQMAEPDPPTLGMILWQFGEPIIPPVRHRESDGICQIGQGHTTAIGETIPEFAHHRVCTRKMRSGKSSKVINRLSTVPRSWPPPCYIHALELSFWDFLQSMGGEWMWDDKGECNME
jgi:hypothetical protein